MKDIETIRLVLETIYYIAAIVGIPVAIAVFILEKRQERRNREINMYLQTAERYMQFLTLNLEHPDLKCGDFTGDEPAIVDSGFSAQQIVLYQILLMTLEQSYYLYKKNDMNEDNSFSRVWHEYIKWWVSRPDFRKAWDAIDPLLAPEFMDFVNAELSKYKDEINKGVH